MVLSICEVCTFFSKLTCNSGALQVILRVMWGEAFQTVLSPILRCFLSPSVGQNWAASLHSCLHLPGLFSVRDFPPCAFVVSELFQEQIVHGKDCYFRKNQRLGCTVTQYKPGCMEQLCLGSCWWLYPDRLMPWSQSAPWWELPRAWPIQPVGCRAALPWLSCGAHGSEAVLASGCIWALCALYVWERCLWGTWWEVTVLSAELLGWQCPLGG